MNVTKPNNLPNNCAILEAAKEGLGPRNILFPYALFAVSGYWDLLPPTYVSDLQARCEANIELRAESLTSRLSPDILYRLGQTTNLSIPHHPRVACQSGLRNPFEQLVMA